MGTRKGALEVVLVLFVCLLLSYSCFCQERTLATNEVATLQLIHGKLQNTGWDFTVDPCSWRNNTEGNVYNTTITCNCNSTTLTCHVTGIWLKGHNLTGELPEEFADLTSLTVLDLTRNYLNGSIPAKWASLPLTILSLLGNRISGRIPVELGSISSLQELVLENNFLQGSIPESLGNLASLRRLLLAANNLTGELPESLGNLKNLSDFRIDGNPISGKFPSFVGNWTKLDRLDMQGTLIEGPFPSTISELTSLTQLRVTDWRGGDGKFPALDNMTKMEYLVLRNLSLSGDIPDFIGNMTPLKNLDLSFNNLTGEIPNRIRGLSSLDFVYFTNNNLTGTITEWTQRKGYWDFSYNSFSETPAPTQCGPSNTKNLASSYSSSIDNSIASCLRKNLPCAGKAENYELYINCGGHEVKVEDKTYQDDTDPLGASVYRESRDQKWAHSNTGQFIGDDSKSLIATNISQVYSSIPELYNTARVSPLCLRYYGFCLQSGNYTVKLHFAEIMFTDDQTYSSLGRRVFDVWIQGEKVLQDFNIARENGTGRVVNKEFTTIVNDTLEIHFQWTGKGTNSIPDRGVYGPLISAISVTPNFDPKIGGTKLSTGAIVGIVLAACVIVVFSAVLIWLRLRRRDNQNDELRGLSLQTGYFSLKHIKAATKNFDLSNKIGEGGFGPVYKGVLLDGSVIAVKQLSSKSKQGNREFINEIGMISALQHPNLVKLYGCCIEGNQLLLIYEYMENNSLARALFGPERHRLKLDWRTRVKICLGVARGLAYLHEESRLKIVHRDIKATNILLDNGLNAKISDFGLAKLDEEENTHISTRIAGTVGYMAPEYAMRGYLTDKADVYSFGVVTLEVVSGISNTNYRPKEDFVYLLDWAYVLQEEGNMLELVDKTLGSNYSKEEALQMLNLALACTNPSPTLRPTMSTVVSMLEGKIPVKVLPVNRTTSKGQDPRFKAFERLSQDSHRDSGFMEESWTDSTVTNPSTSIFESKSPSTRSKLLSDPSE